MRRLRAIIESAFPPPTDSLWLYNNSTTEGKYRYLQDNQW